MSDAVVTVSLWARQANWAGECQMQWSPCRCGLARRTGPVNVRCSGHRVVVGSPGELGRWMYRLTTPACEEPNSAEYRCRQWAASQKDLSVAAASLPPCPCTWSRALSFAAHFILQLRRRCLLSMPLEGSTVAQVGRVRSGIKSVEHIFIICIFVNIVDFQLIARGHHEHVRTSVVWHV